MREACLSASSESMHNVDSALLRSSGRDSKTSFLSIVGTDLTGNSARLHERYPASFMGSELPDWLSLRFLGCLM